MASSSAPGSKLAELEEKLQGLEDQKAAELRKIKGTRDHELLAELNKDLDRVQAAITALSSGTAAGQRAFSVHVASSDEDIDAVDAETDETPVRSFKVSRSHQGKLFLDGIEKALANRGLVLLGIGQDGFPAHKDGWTMTTYNTSPVQLIVAPKPGVRFKQAVAYPTQQTILKQIWQSIVA